MQPTLLAVVVADRDGTIRHWNDDAERLFGEPAGAVGVFGERAGDETAFSPVPRYRFADARYATSRLRASWSSVTSISGL